MLNVERGITSEVYQGATMHADAADPTRVVIEIVGLELFIPARIVNKRGNNRAGYYHNTVGDPVVMTSLNEALEHVRSDPSSVDQLQSMPLKR